MTAHTAVEIPNVRTIGRKETWRLAITEAARASSLLHELEDADWSRPTDCERWDVRGVALHLLGAAEAQASPREMLHQFRVGLPLNRAIDSRHWVDGINELQLRERAHLTNEELVAKFDAVSPRAVAARRRLPPPIRWMPIPMGPPIGWKPLTYLLCMGFTRDVWMHRIDIARATGRQLVVTPDHDGRIIGDIVVEWACRHQEPFRLVLTGPAGGAYVQGDDGEELQIDAIDFCRILSGRGTGTGILRHRLPL
jgi:uncharacterized protein (TIGR03083 family)